MTIDYSTTYNEELMQKSDGHQNLNASQLKFGDALAAVAYAHDIPYEQIQQHWPQYNNERMVMKGVTVQHQMDFINKYATRTPKNILEIGAGRGEVTQFLAAMGYSVTAVEPGVDYEALFTHTKHMLFEDVELDYTVLNKPLHLCDIDYSKFDTILMVESLEHILAEHFDPEWEKINDTFRGYFIVVNLEKILLGLKKISK